MLGRASAPPTLGRIEREDSEKCLERLIRHLAGKREAHEVAIVQEPRGFRNRRRRVIGGGALDQERVGRDADRQHGALRRRVDGLGQPRHRLADDWMLAGIEGPVSGGRHQRPGELQQTSGQLRGKLRGLGHGLSQYTPPCRMRAVDIIQKKRDGAALDREEIQVFVAGVTTRRLARLPGFGLADGHPAPRHDGRRDGVADRRHGALGPAGRFVGHFGRKGRQAQHRAEWATRRRSSWRPWWRRAGWWSR